MEPRHGVDLSTTALPHSIHINRRCCGDLRPNYMVWRLSWDRLIVANLQATSTFWLSTKRQKKLLPHKLVWARGPHDFHIYWAYQMIYFGGTTLVERAEFSKIPLFWRLERAQSWLVEVDSRWWPPFFIRPPKTRKRSQQSCMRALLTLVPSAAAMVP